MSEDGKKEIQALVRAYRDGDSHALNQLIERHTRLVYSFAYRLIGSAEGAQDVTQETFIKAWKNLKRYDDNQSFATWILSIARNTAIDWLRKRKSLVFSDMERDDMEESRDSFEHRIPDDLPLPHEIFEMNELGETLEDALRQISLDRRTIILLRHKDGMAFEEIAVIVEKPLNTVKSQYRRALKTLRDYLTDQRSGSGLINNEPK